MRITYYRFEMCVWQAAYHGFRHRGLFRENFVSISRRAHQYLNTDFFKTFCNIDGMAKIIPKEAYFRNIIEYVFYYLFLAPL